MEAQTSLSDFYMDEDALDSRNIQQAFLQAIYQHRSLVGDMSATLRRLGLAIAESNLNAEEKSVLVAGIGQHVDNAKTIVANIDRALSMATLNTATSRH